MCVQHRTGLLVCYAWDMLLLILARGLGGPLDFGDAGPAG